MLHLTSTKPLKSREQNLYLENCLAACAMSFVSDKIDGQTTIILDIKIIFFRIC